MRDGGKRCQEPFTYARCDYELKRFLAPFLLSPRWVQNQVRPQFQIEHFFLSGKALINTVDFLQQEKILWLRKRT